MNPSNPLGGLIAPLSRLSRLLAGGRADKFPPADMLPPNSMFADPDRVDGSHSTREFVEIGRATVQALIDYEGLKPSHRFLDVGCGIGRMALPLSDYLEKGMYYGFDITEEKVGYCRKTVGRKRPDFVFQHADIFNKYYNPNGFFKAAEYRFPYDDASFDFILLVSVFTHLLPDDLEHYIAEIGRVLRPGGKCVASYWLTDARKGPPLHPYSDVCEIYDPDEPEHGTYYLESYVRGLYARHRLEIQKLLVGSERGRPDSSSSHRQDVIFAVKS